jgi:predicted nucleic acid-binding protein
MTAACFVDANVLVYSNDRSEPFKQEIARALLQRLWREQTGRTSIQALNEFYVVVTRKVSAVARQEDAWQIVEELLDWDPQPVDGALLQRARSLEIRYQLSWWDCLIAAAAQLQGCSILYTEDLQHGADYDGVRICNPFIAEVQEAPATYRVQLVSRHRPRGRPRKAAGPADTGRTSGGSGG